MTMASRQFIKEDGVNVLKISQVAVFSAALLFWAAYFYTIDHAIMEGQGLPVAWTLMPK